MLRARCSLNIILDFYGNRRGDGEPWDQHTILFWICKIDICFLYLFLTIEIRNILLKKTAAAYNIAAISLTIGPAGAGRWFDIESRQRFNAESTLSARLELFLVNMLDYTNYYYYFTLFVVPFTTCVLLFSWCRLRSFLRIYFSLTVDFGLVMRTYFSGNQSKLGKLRPACAETQPDLGLLWRTVSKALLRAAHVLLSRVCVFFPIAAVYSLYFSHSKLSLIQKSCLNFIYS